MTQNTTAILAARIFDLLDAATGDEGNQFQRLSPEEQRDYLLNCADLAFALKEATSSDFAKPSHFV